MTKRIYIAIVLMCGAFSLFAQPRYGIIEMPVCHTDTSGLQQSLTRYVLVSSTGEFKTLLYTNSTGASVAEPTTGTWANGYCLCCTVDTTGINIVGGLMITVNGDTVNLDTTTLFTFLPDRSITNELDNLDRAYNNFNTSEAKITIDAAQGQTGIGLKLETTGARSVGVDILGSGDFLIQDNGTTYARFNTNSTFSLGGTDSGNRRLMSKGKGTTSSTYSAWFMNSDSTYWCYYRDDGVLLFQNTTIGNYFSITPGGIGVGRLNIGGNNGAIGAGSFAIGTGATAVGTNVIAVGTECQGGSGSDVSAFGRYNTVSGSLTNAVRIGNYGLTTVSYSGFLGFGRSATNSIVQNLTESIGIGLLAPVFTDYTQSFTNTSVGINWSSSGDTITTTTPHAAVRFAGIGLANSLGTSFQWFGVVEIISTTKFRVTSAPSGFTSGTAINYSKSEMKFITDATSTSRKFWSISNQGKIRAYNYGDGFFTGNIGTIAAHDVNGNMIEPSPDQVNTYLGKLGIDRSITTDASYTSTDLGARIKANDTTSDLDFTTYTLPATPAEGNIIYFRCIASVIGPSDGCQINGNGHNIMGAATYEFVAQGTITLRYSADGTEWEIY